MLRFTKLIVEDIGPFKGSQTIDFTNENGVTFIWGNNGRGKTTLLNIFRYALFGRFQNRRGSSVDYTMLTNSESRSEGKYGFKVVLHMTYDGLVYELTRQYSPLPGVVHPSKNDEYQSHMFLKRGTSILPTERAEHILKSIMPEQVSRFFLFDGELLQEYEELLINDTDAGAKIKSSIEEILGLPVLTNGATDTGEALEDYQKQKTKAATRDKESQQTASKIEMLTAQLIDHNSELTRLHGLLAEEKVLHMRLESELHENDRIRPLLENIHSVENSIEEKIGNRDALLASIVIETKSAWQLMVRDRVSEVVEEIEIRLRELESKEHIHKVTQQFIQEMESAVSQHHCDICGQDVDEEHHASLVQRIQDERGKHGGLTTQEAEELQSLRSRQATLKPMNFSGSKDKLAFLEQQLRDVNVAISDNERHLKTLKGDLEKYGDAAELDKRISDFALELAKSGQKIQNYEEGINAQNEKISKARSLLQGLNEKLDAQAKGAEVDAARHKAQLCEQIYGIFEEGIAKYRDKLKSDVEQDATDLFRQISADKDYERLSINENYGLSIVHSSGSPVPLRSAGYEHIVALSLIGALHKNAPLRGPIIMDSPFGRLDPTHKSNITSTLPHMSEQIVLLAYTSEINEQDAREKLGAELKREYYLARKTSFNTRIEAQTI